VMIMSKNMNLSGSYYLLRLDRNAAPFLGKERNIVYFKKQKGRTTTNTSCKIYSKDMKNLGLIRRSSSFISDRNFL